MCFVLKAYITNFLCAYYVSDTVKLLHFLKPGIAALCCAGCSLHKFKSCHPYHGYSHNRAYHNLCSLTYMLILLLESIIFVLQTRIKSLEVQSPLNFSKLYEYISWSAFKSKEFKSLVLSEPIKKKSCRWKLS